MIKVEKVLKSEIRGVKMKNNNSQNERRVSLMKASLGEELINFLEDDNVVEIMLNSDKKLWIDTHSEGRIYTGVELKPTEAERVIKVIASSADEIIDDKNPIISAELLEYGSRFEGIMPPVVQNPVFTIRKKAILVYTLEDYLKKGSLTEEQYHLVKKCIENKKNILIIGGTGTGKTTLTNAIINEIKKDRLVILEDTQEIQSNAEDTVFLRTSPHVNMRQLLRSTMRLRPDRICVGEVRGGEALDLLKAWNSGHPGGVSTIHADDSIGGLNKLEQYIQEVSNNPQRELIGNAVDVVIVIKRMGLKRVVDEIKTVTYCREKRDYILEGV